MSAEIARSGASIRMRDQRDRFADACGMTGVVRLNVRHLESGELTKFDLEQPFALIGRGPACQIQLPDPAVSKRHAYFQVLHGRVHCFDLGSRTGIRFRDGLRVEGILSDADSLIIGPYQVRLSQAPAYRLQATGDGGLDFENLRDEEAHLAFRNAQGRSSRTALRPVRERVTLIGRSPRCHVKLTDDSVGMVHASIVRTPVGHWFINLRPDRKARLRGETVLCEPLSVDDKLEIGRFRMRFGFGRPAAESAGDQVPENCSDVAEQDVVSAELTTNKEVLTRNAPRVQNDDRDDPGRGSFSEQIVLAAIEQFGQMQRQLLGQTHQQSMMLARMMAAMQQEQNSAIYEQIARIQSVTDELMTLQRPRLELKPEIPANIAISDEVSQIATVESADSVEAFTDSASDPTPAVKSGNEPREEFEVDHDRQGSHSASTRHSKSDPDRSEAYHRVTSRIHELERERTRGWQKVMSLLGVKEDQN